MQCKKNCGLPIDRLKISGIYIHDDTKSSACAMTYAAPLEGEEKPHQCPGQTWPGPCPGCACVCHD